MPAKSELGLLRRTPLAAHILGMFALADASAAFGGTIWTVTSCSNDTTGFGATGTLRYALNHAIDGDTVDMTALVCSTIRLDEAGTTVAPLPIPDGMITVLGPGRDKLTIAGGDTVRIFSRSSVMYTSLLVLKDLSLNLGNAGYDPITAGDGGCILTTDTVTLDRVSVGPCTAAGSGGGIRATNVTLDHSIMAGNVANGDGGGISAPVVDVTASVVTSNQAVGNGAGIRGNFVTLTGSTISDNIAGINIASSAGGGLFVAGNLTLTGSTVNRNIVYGTGGGIDAYSGSPSGVTTTIVNSTISGNTARGAAGGIYANSGHVKFYNSTIAFNYADLDSTKFASGVAVGGYYGDLDLTFHSTLISNNLGGSTEHDFSVATGGHSVTLHGSHNFARTADYVSSVFSFQGACPLLGPLRDNGGPTWTHALSSKSPAIDAGDNVVPLSYDQRGPPFSRVANGTADIGAYEVQADVVFYSGFEGC